MAFTMECIYNIQHCTTDTNDFQPNLQRLMFHSHIVKSIATNINYSSIVWLSDKRIDVLPI